MSSKIKNYSDLEKNKETFSEVYCGDHAEWAKHLGDKLDFYAFPVTPFRRSVALEHLKQCREASLSKAEFTQEEYVPTFAKGVCGVGVLFLQLAIFSLLPGSVAELLGIVICCKVFYYNVVTLDSIRLYTPPALQSIYQTDHEEFVENFAGKLLCQMIIEQVEVVLSGSSANIEGAEDDNIDA
jgi:hypothetical protein